MAARGRMLIYLAGPLFSEAERRFNRRLTARLEEAGFRVFSPQRDGVKRSEPPYNQLTREARSRAIFERDRSKIFEADVFLFVLDGRVPDEGACVELGIAHCQRVLVDRPKLLVGLRTDVRAAFPDSDLNPMLRVPLEFIAEDEGTLLQVLQTYRSQIGSDLRE